MNDRIVDRQTCQMLGAEIEAAIDPILEKHGFKRGKTQRTYGEFFQIKVQASPIGAPSPQANDFARYATLFDLPADALGREITLGGRRFTITGLNTRAPKNPVLIEEVGTGRGYKSPVDSVKFALTR